MAESTAESTEDKKQGFFKTVNWRRIFYNMALLTAGSAILAVSVNGILVPKQFLAGGFLGLVLIFHYLLPFLDPGLLYAILNLPLVLLGWFRISRRFVLYTAFGIGVFSLATALIRIKPLPVENLLLAAILAGIIGGTGAGLVFRSLGSLGGMDILAIFLNKKWDIRLGWSYMLFNGLVLLLGAFVFSLEVALYAMIYTFTVSKVMDAVVTGFNQRESVIIISDKAQAIAEQIMTRLKRGVTFLQGQGAYTGQEKKIILTVATLTELGRMKDLVFDIDPQAFVVINQALEVLGKRHGSRRVY
ncbi:MAG: YitT family protein [Deltaproteobacteria bacterium]|nr:YitT family protein [Deltaproteobacteria bacterium]